MTMHDSHFCPDGGPVYRGILSGLDSSKKPSVINPKSIHDKVLQISDRAIRSSFPSSFSFITRTLSHISDILER